MLLIPGLLAYIVGKLRKGNLRNLVHLPLQRVYLFYISLLLQLAARTQPMEGWAPQLMVLSYLLLLLSLALNIRLPGMPFLFLGTLLNALVISLNGGQMPVALELLDLPLEGGYWTWSGESMPPWPPIPGSSSLPTSSPSSFPSFPITGSTVSATFS